MALMLDTNALIALAMGDPMRADARLRVAAAYDAGALIVSATAAWEVGLLATQTGRTAAIFGGDGRRWFAAAVERFALTIVPLDAAMALEAAYLPGALASRDPADKWTVAVARVLGIPLVTSDRAILAYAAAGFLEAVRR